MKASEFIIEAKKDRRDKKYNRKPKTPNPVAKNAMAAVGGGGFGAHKDKKKEQKQGKEKHKAKAMTVEVAERIRDPEDWDEGNTEPPNNFAIYINGKKWKVFKGRGRYAEDDAERRHYQQLKAWAAQKSAATGKKWEVYVTGEPATEGVGEANIPFAGAAVGHKEGPAGQWRNKGPKAKKPAKEGDLVGG